MIIVLGLIAYIIAIFSVINKNNIFGVVSYAWSGLGSSFGPALVMTLWYKKTTRLGVISGLFVGFMTTIVWTNFEILNSFLSERLMSFMFAFLVIYLVSLSDQNENKTSFENLKNNVFVNSYYLKGNDHSCKNFFQICC